MEGKDEREEENGRGEKEGEGERARPRFKIGGYHRYLGQRRGERFSVCSNRIDSTR